MKRNAQIREEARHLRTERHMALGDIAATLGVPKGTAYYWLKDIQIPKTITDKQKLNQQRGTLANQTKCAARRKDAYDSAYSNARELLSERPIRDFVVLY